MIKRIFLVTLIVIVLLGLYGIISAINTYRDDRQTRINRLQEKAEEVKVTILEGWTVEEISEELESKGLFSAKDFLSSMEKLDASIFAYVVKPENTDLEGYLFPDTYQFAKESTPEMVIEKMLDNFAVRLRSIGVTQDQTTFIIPGYEDLDVSGADRQPGLSLYDLLTLASIVERESGGKGAVSGQLTLDDERKLVAGVFYNRLAIGQALESDATVNYITGKNTPGVSIVDTQINSPYNTYRYAGMPPGPIGNPSLGSIKAVLNPTTSDFYYFLHKQPSGKVDFSRNFSEHVQKKD